MLGSIIRARYEGGVFRPIHPVALREGEEVNVYVANFDGLPHGIETDPKYSDAYREALARVRNARTFDEACREAEVDASLEPELPDDYDIVEAMQRNRQPGSIRIGLFQARHHDPNDPA
jgi:predicted DNA-binding antitoxin AbrB/MazE fold protein